MGSIFKYISDELLSESAETSCPACRSSNPAFTIDATPEQEEWGARGPRVDSLCATCIRSIPLRRLAPRDQEMVVQQLINAHYGKGILKGWERLSKLLNICDELRRTPHIPLFLQGEDWPYCCGDFMEYIGTPSSYDESIRVAREMDHWDHGPRSFSAVYGEMALEPESLEEVCIFRCFDCSSKVFTWQAT